MEITKGENANLAGMEPRCPKCKAPASIYWMIGHHEGKCNGVDCEYRSVNWQEFFHAPEGPKIEVIEVCPENAPDKHSVRINGKEIVAFDSGHSAHSVAGNLRMALIPLFRSPAPTPPLDVEAEKRITEIRERESKATKGPYTINGGGYLGIIAVVDGKNSQIGRAEACGDRLSDEQVEDNARFFAHARLDIPFLLEQISLLRRHIASPAPQSHPMDRKMLEAVAEDGLLVTWDKDYKFSFSQVVRLMAEFALECEPANPCGERDKPCLKHEPAVAPESYKPAASLIPRLGMSWACALQKNHEGACAPGGTCVKHGKYICRPNTQPQCPKWPDCITPAATPVTVEAPNGLRKLANWLEPKKSTANGC